MKQKHLTPHMTTLAISILTILIIITIGILILYDSTRELRSDFDRLSSEDYDSVFLSMYPIDTYREEDFTIWRGQDTIITTYEIPNALLLREYLQKITESNPNVNTVYLGIRPDHISGQKAAELLVAYPQYTFQVVLSYPSMEYWTALSNGKCRSQLEAYRDCINALVEQPTAPANASVYFYGSTDWVISNPDNYEEDFLTCEFTSLQLMLHLDTRYPYYLKPGTAVAAIDSLAAAIEREKQTPTIYPDLSNKNIIFFGDSVIGNYNNVNSIPGVLSGLTDANTYNIAMGGTRATQTDTGSVGLNYYVNAFINQDLTLLPTESQPHLGLSEYIASGANTPDCFIINYGLNDYYEGFPIASDDPYDISTYVGAFRTAVDTLRQTYPDAHILVITPNFTSYFNNGNDSMSDHGHVLEDYADALISLARELDIAILDNYHELDINAENHEVLLSDGCHPNEFGRFIIGQRIAAKLASLLTE